MKTNYDPSKHSNSAIEGSIAVFQANLNAAKHDRRLQRDIPELEEKIRLGKAELAKRSMTA